MGWADEEDDGGDWWLSDGLHQSWQSGSAGVVDDTVGILATTHKSPYTMP